MALIGERPLIDFTIRAALGAALPGKICLTTDDAEIRKYGMNAGVEVPFLRPTELAQDGSSTLSVIEHAIQWYENHGFEPQHIILLQPTSPFRSSRSIREAYDMIRQSNADALISVNAVHEHPCEYIIHGDRRFSYVMKPPDKPGRQNFPHVYCINGAIYIARTAFLKKTGMLFDTSSLIYVMDRSESLDIDNPEDLEFANWIYENKLKPKE
jgi:CMP-N,N'-diacetyllegionaminic acid synthase